MTWTQKNEYYLENNGWTICKTGIQTVKYGLWYGAINHGWFDTSAEAITKWKELNK
jgi:hypothetical protein